MGWYDAYRGDTARVNTNLDTKGDVGVAIGDAFTNFGKAVNEDATRKQESELKTLQIDNAKEDSAQKKKERAQADIDNAYLADAYKNSTKKTFDENRDTSITPSATAVNLANTHFDKELERLKTADDKAQVKYNSSLTKAYASGEYKSFKELRDANPELVDFADGATVAGIKKAYDDNSKEILKLKQEQTNLEHQSSILKKDTEIATLRKTAGKTEGGYDGETTNGKIVTLLKTSLGMSDQLMNGFSDEQKTAFDKNVAEISTIAKNYNLSSNLAFTAWQNLNKARMEQEAKNNADPLGLNKK